MMKKNEPQRERSDRELNESDIWMMGDNNRESQQKQKENPTKKKESRPYENFRKGRSIPEKKEIFIDVVIDGTFSFTKIFVKFNQIIEDIVRKIGREKANYMGIAIKYGLTVIHDEARPIKFADGSYFTEQEEAFLSAVKEIEFYGGSPNGRENLRDGLDTGLRILNNYSSFHACRGLLLFSDSLPEPEDLEPDFLSDDQDGYINKGIHFAMMYTYTDEFVPKLKIVDSNGSTAENEKNEVFFYRLSWLLSSEGDEIIEKIQHIVDRIFTQVSEEN